MQNEIVAEWLPSILIAVGGVAVFVGFTIEAVKRTEMFGTRTLPIVSLILGVLVGFVIALGFNMDIPTYMAAGFIGGGFASGMYDSIVSLLELVTKFIKGGK